MMEKNWMTGRELMELLDLTHWELNDMIFLGLPMYDRLGCPVVIPVAKEEISPPSVIKARIRDETTPKELIPRLEYLLGLTELALEILEEQKFRLSDVQSFLKNYNGSSDPVPASQETACMDEKFNPFSREEQDRSRSRTPAERKQLAMRMKEEGKTKQEVAERLFCHDLDHENMEALKKRVQRIWNE